MTPEFLKADQERIEAQLALTLDQLEETPEMLLAAMRHSLLNGGKRIRAVLIYLVGELFNVDGKLLNDAAVAIECIHAFSLIHDDLPAIDNATLRRGKPACHIAFGEATAILAADALHTLAFEVLSGKGFLGDEGETRLNMLYLLAKATGPSGVVSGEWLDIDAEGKAISLEQLEDIHHLKTGVLIEAAVLIGACASHITQAQQDVFSDYGRAIGLGFQIQDDILDVISDTHTLGKDAGLDQADNKTTFVSLLGLEAAKHKRDAAHQKALSALRQLPFDTDKLIQLTDYLIHRQA